MAVFTRTNGASESYTGTGRTIALTKFSKTNISAAELDAIVANIQATSSIVAIGSDQSTGPSFVAGTSDDVWVISEGIAPVATSNFAGQTGLTSSVVAYFNKE